MPRPKYRPAGVSPSFGSSGGLLIGDLSGRVDRLDMFGDQLADHPLLFGNAADRVDDAQSEFVDDAVVLVEHLALNQPAALGGIAAPAEVHTGLVELQLHAARHEAIERHVDGHAKI